MTDREWADRKVAMRAERRKPGNPKEGTVIEDGGPYKGAPVVVSARATWITEADLDSRQTTWQNKRTKKIERGSLRDYIRENLKGYAVTAVVGGQTKYLSPLASETDHGLYRAFQYDLGDRLFGKGADGKPVLASMVENVDSLTNETRPAETRDEKRENNQVTRVYALRQSPEFVISVVVDPKNGRVITSGVEFPEGRLITRPDIPELRARVEKWKTDQGYPVRTKIVDVGGRKKKG